MTTTIEINGLRIYAHHGVMEQERCVGNLFEVSVSVRYPFDGSDNLDGTLNYAQAAAVIKDVMKHPRQLLEAVVFDIKDALSRSFPLIEGGRIRVAKLTPPMGEELDSVAVVIEW